MGNQHRLTSLGLSPTAGCTVTRTLAVWSPSSASSTVPLLPARLARISSFSVEMPAARAALPMMEAGVGLSTRARDRARVGAGVGARVGLGSWLRLGSGHLHIAAVSAQTFTWKPALTSRGSHKASTGYQTSAARPGETCAQG